ncbi:MAG: hypothetical protein R3B70_23680 [Polyangiaceae bacterium]
MNHRDLDAPIVKSLRAAALALLPAALAACAGPPLTSPIEGEPVCADIEVGAARVQMTGGLRFPVQVTIKRGDTVSFKTTVLGRRTAKELATRILLSDDDEKYTVEWGQCENERAPSPVEGKGRDTKGSAHYECGTAAVYKTDELVTKKGDPKSHVITFAPPPNPACAESNAPPAADAGAPDAGSEPADAGAPDAEAAAEDAGDADSGAADGGDTGSGAADAGEPAATDAGTSTGSPDAGASDAGASDAGATSAPAH